MNDPRDAGPPARNHISDEGLTPSPLPPERALLDALFAQSPLSVALYDADGRVATGNAAYERHFGARLADVPRDWSILTDPQLERAGLTPLIRRAYAGEVVVLPPVRYDAARATGSAGRTVWTQGHCYPVRDDAGRVTHLAIMHVDVTPLVETREAVEDLNLELEERHALLREQAMESEAQSEELQSATEELMLRTEELARARDAVEVERARLGRVVAQLPAAVAVLEGPELVYRGMSAQYRAFVGGRDVIGRPIREALSELAGVEGGPDFFALMERVFRTGETYFASGIGARWDADGDGVAEDHYVDVTYAPLYGPSGNEGGRAIEGVLVKVLDVTARVRSELAERAALAEANRAAERARRLQALTARLNAAASLETVADVILEGGMAAVGADAGSLALVHADVDGRLAHFEMIRSTGYRSEIAARYRTFPVAAGRPLSDAVLEQRTVLIDTAEEWRRLYPGSPEDLSALGFSAFVALPVIVDERVAAALSFTFRTPQSFDEGTRTFLATLGEQCSLALARARAFAAVRRGEEASAFLAGMSALLAETLDYETTLRAVAETVVPRLGDWCAVDVIRDPTLRAWPPTVDRLAIVQRDPEMRALGDELMARYPTDWSAERGMAQVLREGTPMFIPRVTDEMLVGGARDAEHLRLLRALRFSSIIVVPLKARGLTLGALTLAMGESGRTYDEADLALAQDLAQRAGIAVDNARLYRDAARAREGSEAANRAKSQFLATMSHELRTPLNAIQGHVQLLELGIHGDITDAQRGALARVQRAQQHLLGLIDEVLGYARLESGRVEYDVRAVVVADVVADVRPMVDPQLAARGLELAIDLPDHGAAPSRVLADREKLAQVLINLLSNAAKFTPEGGRVTIALVDDGVAPVGADRVQLRVSDTGIGIPPDKLEAIFEPFVQVRGPYNPAQGGTGLGLAISRDLVRGMGGEIRAESEPGRGSTFVITLKRA